MRIVGELSPAIVRSLAASERCQTLEDVLAWAHATGGALVDVMVQDEYTHDVIIGGPTPAYLCFDTT